jgi:hypothetical protein
MGRLFFLLKPNEARGLKARCECQEYPKARQYGSRIGRAE